MNKESYTQLVVLSSSFAASVKQMLDDNAIPVKLSPAEALPGAEGDFVRISVAKSCFDEAVGLLESIIDLTASPRQNSATPKGVILIPVDFSDKGLMGATVGFELANRLSAHPVILHSYAVATREHPLSIVNTIAGDDDEPMRDREVAELQEIGLKKFSRSIAERQKQGRMLDVKYTAELRRGVPEDVILDYSRTVKPKLIVMATRNRHKIAEELVGSVTAEVLDSCRVPLFTVPEDYDFPGIRAIRKIVFFCNLDKQDVLSMDTFMRLFDYPDIEVTLVPVSERYGDATARRVDELMSLFRECYPSASFGKRIFPAASFRDDFREFADSIGMELIIVQNKKKNIFSRLINPGIAHILFYERDMPMIVLPT